MKKLVIMKSVIIPFFILFLALTSQAQDTKFTVSVSTDSILLGNFIEVKFTLENAKGTQFEPPTFDGFRVVNGPNQSTSMSIINGDMTQTASFTYWIEPVDIGNYFIAPASIQTKNEVLETAPIEVLVVPNPDGIIQRPQQEERPSIFGNPFFETRPNQPVPPQEPAKKSKKKRKTYRI